MKNVNCKRNPHGELFPGHSFQNVNYRLASQKYEEYADEATKAFYGLQKEFGEEAAKKKEFEEI